MWLVRGDITVDGSNQTTWIAIKNCAPFVSCITKTDGVTKGDVKD